MVEFLSKYGIELVMSLITAGALAFCKYMHGQMKNYKKLLEEKDHDELNDEIDKKLEPIVQEIEELRKYIREVDVNENNRINLIISSYKFRLIQLCQIYLRQGYMTSDQYEQLSEFFKVYSGLGGNGQAKQYYDKAMELPVKD